MKKVFSLIVLAGFITMLACKSQRNQTPAQEILALYRSRIDSLQLAVDAFKTAVKDHKGAVTLRAGFEKARLSYQYTELFAEYYNPSTAKAINGPALDEVEPDNPEYPARPTGFQVIEELLYPMPDSVDYANLLNQASALKDAVTRLAMVSSTLELTDAHVFDAMRLELFRLITLGVSGFDSPLALHSLPEAREKLLALQWYMAPYHNKGSGKNYKTLAMALQQAGRYLGTNTNFNSFNRALFIATHINPLCKYLHAWQTELGIPFFDEARPLKSTVASLFDENAFDPYAYSPDHRAASAALAQLGGKLFSDPRLSAGARRSCASCHQPGRAFTDGLAKNNSFNGQAAIKRNTPTILYAALQNAQFADSRLAYLEDQAKQVIENPDEMHGNLSTAAAAINADSQYRRLFKDAGIDTVTTTDLQQALAAFIRSQGKFNSRFDNYMRGNLAAMNGEEILGFNLFMGKAKCGTCHFTPLFSGNAPPAYNKSESEVLGVPATATPPYQLDEDEGKFALYKAAPHKFSFKTPTLRNIAATAPYMHNGVFNTLEEVVDFYNKGGGAGLGLQLENQTLPPDELKLTAAEQKAIVAFMNALSDK